MTDERIVEVIANARWKIDYGQRSRDEVGNGEEWDRYTVPEARRVLAALRGAGFDVYRPDDCPKVEVEDGGEYADYQTGERRRAEPILRGRLIQDTRCVLPTGTYRLVPVGGEG